MNAAHMDDAHKETRREVFGNIIRLYYGMVQARAHTFSKKTAYSQVNATHDAVATRGRRQNIRQDP